MASLRTTLRMNDMLMVEAAIGISQEVEIPLSRRPSMTYTIEHKRILPPCTTGNTMPRSCCISPKGRVTAAPTTEQALAPTTNATTRCH